MGRKRDASYQWYSLAGLAFGGTEPANCWCAFPKSFFQYPQTESGCVSSNPLSGMLYIPTTSVRRMLQFQSLNRENLLWQTTRLSTQERTICLYCLSDIQVLHPGPTPPHRPLPLP